MGIADADGINGSGATWYDRNGQDLQRAAREQDCRAQASGLFETLAAWQQEQKDRHFLVRTRHTRPGRQFGSGGYWIEVTQGTLKFEIQAENINDATSKVRDAIKAHEENKV